MLFNVLLAHPDLLYTPLYAFLGFFLFRHLFVKQKIWIIGYHTVLFFLFFIAIIGGGGSYNEASHRLEKFIEIEQHPSPDKEKLISEQKDGMLERDFQQFKNSAKFLDHLKHQDKVVERIERMSLGWLFFLLSDLALGLIAALRYSVRKIQHLFTPPFVS